MIALLLTAAALLALAVWQHRRHKARGLLRTGVRRQLDTLARTEQLAAVRAGQRAGWHGATGSAARR